MTPLLKNRHVFIFLALLAIPLVSVHCSNSDSDRTHGPALSAALRDTASRYNAPGAVLMVKFEDGSVWTGETGLANIDPENRQPMTADYRWRIGSITKTFVATAVLLLVQEDRVSLADSLESWLPGIVPNGDRISVRMLLNHSSGLYDYTHDEDFLRQLLDQPETDWTPGELVDIANQHGPEFEPGQTVVYCNTNYILLGLLIEAASGQEIGEFLQDNIFAPLGMTQTTFPKTNQMPPIHASGYLDLNLDGMFTPEEDMTTDNVNAYWTAGAIVSTPHDMLTWLSEFIDSNLLAPPIQAERMTFDAAIEGYEDSYFGLGVVKRGESIGHTGGVLGFSSFAFQYRGVYFLGYTNGVLTAPGSVNIANEIYAAAVKAIFKEEVSI